MTRAWAEVHKGTDRTDEQVLQDFAALYAQDMYLQQEHNITDITMQQLRDAFSNVKKNATGPDAWDDVAHKADGHATEMADEDAQRD